MKIMLTIIISLIFLLPITAQAAIYKCTIAGKLVFTDQPCEGEKVTLGLINSMPAEEKPFEYVENKAPYSSNQWYYGHAGYKRALRLLKKYDTSIFLYFQADWCGYCRTLEEQLINTRAAKVALKKVIKVKVSPEDAKQDDAFFRRLGGTGYPSLFLQSGDLGKPKKISAYPNKKLLSVNELSRLLVLP